MVKDSNRNKILLCLEISKVIWKLEWKKRDGIIDSIHESEQTLGDSEGQGSLACCPPWGHNSETRLSDQQQD